MVVRIFLWDMISPYSQLLFTGIRYILLKSMIKECGDNVIVAKNVVVKNWKNLSIGKNVSIHPNCYIDALGNIIIGNDVSIAHNTSILSFEHTWENSELPIKYNELQLKSTIIDDNVWIGCGCRILGGVKIASRSIIAAGAVINKSNVSDTIYAGIPGKLIKKI
ncbi:acyltransferase [Spirochaetia bacterium]|nr:acyltransferase [Spirochaetia bacterium]